MLRELFRSGIKIMVVNNIKHNRDAQNLTVNGKYVVTVRFYNTIMHSA